MTVTTTPGGSYNSPIEIKIDGVCCKDIRWKQTVSAWGGQQQDHTPGDSSQFMTNTDYYPQPIIINRKAYSTGSNSKDAPGFYDQSGSAWNVLDPLSVIGGLGTKNFETCAFCYDSKPAKPLGCVNWTQSCAVWGTCQITVNGFSTTPSKGFDKVFPQ
jgi:hypothetical protein